MKCHKRGLIHSREPENGELSDCLREYIPKMPNDDLDCAVDEEVFGFHRILGVPNYSTDIAAAFLIFQKKAPRGSCMNYSVSHGARFDGTERWWASFGPISWDAETPARAIAELALFLERCETA